MKLLGLAAAAAIFGATTGTGLADGYPAVPLLSSSETVLGETIAYPTTGKAVISAMIVTLGPGERTVVHKHGVPLFAYVLEGEVTVDYGEHGTMTFKQGDSFLEAMNADHAGINNGGTPVRILAVYMGAEGSENVIPKP
jgi:quercetin dioxygenase-like cupin family protein